jgi:hypothetical protein
MPRPIWKTAVYHRVAGVLTGLLLLLVPHGRAQETGTPAPPPCSGPEYRQFDFWVGEWDVTQPDGTPAGTNRIEIILGGCVLFESWESATSPHEGHSFNIYGRDGKWHQTWVDNGGLLLELVGGLVDGRMVMSQDRTRPDGKTVHHEVSWEKLETGQVRQHWRASSDGGQTWNDVFVGIYTKKE